MLETGTMARFARVGNFSSYCRCVDSLREEQRQEEGRRQRQERQQVLGLGLCGSGELCHALLPASQEFL